MKQWYSINAKAESNSAEILIYDQIGASFFGDGVTAKQFAEDLRALKVPLINLRINSPGGDVFDGFAIYNSLLRHPARIEVDIDGMAASIASVVALAGNEVRMAKNALFMIHDPWGFVSGTASDMRAMSDTLDKIRDNIVGVYHDRTNKDAKALQKWMAEETWFDGEEAQAAGFVDVVTSAREVTACADLSAFKYRNIPQDKVTPVAAPQTARPALEQRRAARAHEAHIVQQMRRTQHQ